VAVQGNLDPLHLFLPREELDARVQDILRRAGSTGHIFNLGHGILPPTDPEAAKFLVDAVHRHGAELLRAGA
jgi:uroporphyrinogen decarboxylase